MLQLTLTEHYNLTVDHLKFKQNFEIGNITVPYLSMKVSKFLGVRQVEER
jgi:hypothetical protein